MKLRRCNKYMFQTVKCSKYMRKINDGKCITLLTGDETENGKPAYFYTDYSEKKEQIKVAIVAYGCNKTRLVPMDSFEIIKEEDKC